MRRYGCVALAAYLRFGAGGRWGGGRAGVITHAISCRLVTTHSCALVVATTLSAATTHNSWLQQSPVVASRGFSLTVYCLLAACSSWRPLLLLLPLH